MISAILLSGGIGSRSGKNIPKQYCDLLGQKVICYCLDSLLNTSMVDELIVVYGEGFFETLQGILLPYTNKFKEIKLVCGGATRQESVFNGLKDCSFETVLLHESARPLITSDDIELILNHPSRAITMGMDIPYTVLKQKNGLLTEILERKELFNVQLPQKFPKDILIKAHFDAEKDKREFTDDSSLFFAYNGEVTVLNGSSENIKITNPNDFLIAEEILIKRNSRQEN